jgi:hypothetical protein
MFTIFTVLVCLLVLMIPMALIGLALVLAVGEEAAGPIFASLFVYGIVTYMIFNIDVYVGMYFIVVPAAIFFIYLATAAVKKITGI